MMVNTNCGIGLQLTIQYLKHVTVPTLVSAKVKLVPATLADCNGVAEVELQLGLKAALNCLSFAAQTPRCS